MIEILYILGGAAAYCIKGGQLGRIPGWNKLRAKNPILDFIMDGKPLSSAFVGGLLSPLLGLAWLTGVSPKMGRIVGQIGGYMGNWDENEQPYPLAKTAKEKAIEGWKAGVQRGVFLGAMLALATGNVSFIVAGALFPVTAWIGVSIMQSVKNKLDVDWVLHEVLMGAVLGATYAFF